MSLLVIQKKLLAYQCQTVLEQEHALKEIAQEIALMALSRAGFFKIAAFQGGTCLRILYGLERFSEDLDCFLEKSDKNFNWETYIKNMQEEFSAYGYVLEVTNKTKIEKTIKKAFLKADSKGGLLILKDTRTNRPLLQIKLEIDTNPPDGSQYDLKYLDFPIPYGIKTQNLSSLFASKCHALLCRDYIKGRDWYDFSWYVTQKTSINFELLKNALFQAGPWKDRKIIVSREWILQALIDKIDQTNWVDAKKDIMPFLKQKELATLELWSKEFFHSRVKKLAGYLWLANT
jgi:predicted nucleotidyltransferase component of viral defense system